MIQRFGSDEHRQIGDSASGGAATDILLDDGTHLSYGEMVAMGDFFGSLDEIRRLAATPAGQAEVRWVRWFALHNGSEPTIPENRKSYHRNHYYELAANNISHFSAGGNARNAYDTYHQQALAAAFLSGITGDAAKYSEAMTTEAFGNHFLTDMFSAGHVRTPRQEMREFYQSHFGDSVNQFVTYMAAWITHRIDTLGGIPWSMPNSGVQDKIQEQVRALGGAALDSYSLGDIVSLAFHNHDNRGLGVISDVDPSGQPTPGGFHWTAMGDDHLADGESGSSANIASFPISQASITRRMVSAAVAASIQDLEGARAHGFLSGAGPSISPTELESHTRAMIANFQPFKAEKFIPREDPTAGNEQMDWHWPLTGTLRAEVDHDAKNTIGGQLMTRASSAPPTSSHWLLGTVTHIQEAFRDFATLMQGSGITLIETIISGTAPSTGGGGGPAAGDASQGGAPPTGMDASVPGSGADAGVN